jgi:Na+/melibiose symporter-like transporter
MGLYNKIMLYFWLVAGILIFIVVTVMGFKEGFKIWNYYYLFSGLAILMFIVRRWMMKRMEKHLKYLSEQNKD